MKQMNGMTVSENVVPKNSAMSPPPEHEMDRRLYGIRDRSCSKGE